MRKTASLIALSLTLAAFQGVALQAPAADSAIASRVDASALSKKKQTNLGLYVTAAETNAALQSRKDLILIDVRTPEETMFVGYPVNAAVNIPFKVVDPKYQFNAKKRSYRLIVAPDFVTKVRAYLKSGAGKNAKTLVLMCRSGSRSAQAVNALAKAGFTNAYSMVDGFEGDKDQSGRRTVNGWKNSAAPWTTKLRKDYRFQSR